MTRFSLTKKTRHTLIASAISLLFVIFLVRSIDWKDFVHIAQSGFSPDALLLFSLTACAIALFYGYRWRLLLGHDISRRTSLIAIILSLGGNMFLPARGGDILRVHYSHVVATKPHSEILSRLFLEKIIDLITVAIVGILAAALFHQTKTFAGSSNWAVLLLATVTAISVAVAVVKYRGDSLLRCVRPAFRIIGKAAFFDRHAPHLMRDASRNLTVPIMLMPTVMTLAMWLSIHALSYIVAARFVGVTLSYPESLVLLFAGALGLMLPAAPSGVGTFHASIVSAFIFLGRSATEGLLVASVIHLLFFVAFVVPAATLYIRWRTTQNIPS